MRDFFAIIAIILAVIGLGVFQVPDENALVAAGIKAAADGAVYQEKHPVRITVKGREITASGRVETEAEARSIEARLTALDGVESVIGDWVILPNADPFDIRFKVQDGQVSVAGFVPDEPSKAAILAALELQEADLTVAAGVPDRDWAEVAHRLAQDMPRLMQGEARLTGRRVQITGQIHLPTQKTALEQHWAALPDGYESATDLRAVDDGLPYHVTLTRDTIIGASAAGKLPPDVLPEALSGFASEFTQAPFALDYPGFEQALELGLSLFDPVPHGSLSVTPGVIFVQGGPLSADQISGLTKRADEAPDGYTVQLTLVPEGDGKALTLTASWDGAQLTLSGHVPANFWGKAEAQDQSPEEYLARQAGFAETVSARLSFAPHPDLGNWSEPFWRALPALAALSQGELSLIDGNIQITGTAKDPAARHEAARVLGQAGTMSVLLQDDGAPARFSVTYDAAIGGTIAGKLPAGLTPDTLAEAFELPSLRGTVRVASDGDGGAVLTRLAALSDWMDLVDGFTLDFDEGQTSLTVFALPGMEAGRLQERMRAALPGLTVHVDTAAAPLEGTRRRHVFLDKAQVFSGGYWLPSLSFEPNVEACTRQSRAAPEIPFERGQFTPAFRSYWPLAHHAAVARQCARFGGKTGVVSAHVSVSEIPALNRQLSRRRAEAVRQALIERGISKDKLQTRPADDLSGPDRIVIGWQ